MKEKIIQNLLFAIITVASTGMVFAQEPNLGPFGLETPIAFSQLRHLDQNSMKVASHDDFPSAKLGYMWNGAGWDTTSQYTYLYNSNGTVAVEQYDTYTNNQLTPSSKYNYTYDANGNRIELILLNWTGSAWENNFHSISSFDSQGNESQVIYEYWAFGAWMIHNGYRYTRQYNGANQITEEFSEHYIAGNSSWVLDRKIEYQFSAGVWTEVVYSQWLGNAWQISGRDTDIVWHDFAKRLRTAEKSQTYSNGAYSNEYRMTCIYSQFDSQECIYESFNGTWQNATKKTNDFDRLGHQIQATSSSWSGNWGFNIGAQYNYTYDAQDRTLEIIYQNLLSPTTTENRYKEVFSNFFTSAQSALDANVNVTAFPNPVTDQLNFDLKLEKNGPVSIALFDIQGRKRLETMSNYNGNVITIPISTDLENGVYFYNLKMGDAFAKGKVVVQH